MRLPVLFLLAVLEFARAVRAATPESTVKYVASVVYRNGRFVRFDS